MRRGGHNCTRLSVLHALCSRRTARLWPGWPLLARAHGTLGASNDPQLNAGLQARSAARHHRSPSSLQRQPGCACRRHGGVVALKPHSAALTQEPWCRKVHARYKELLQVKELKASLLTAAHGVDQQRALAVRIPPPLPSASPGQPPSLAVCSDPGALRPCVLGPRAACASEPLPSYSCTLRRRGLWCGHGRSYGPPHRRWAEHQVAAARTRPPPAFPRFRGQMDCLCCSRGHTMSLHPPCPRFAGMNTRSSCMQRVGARQVVLPA